MEEVKCEQVGMLSGNSWDKCHETNRRVYSSNGLSPTITTMGGGQREPKIIEPRIAAMRGRNPDNPSDRTAGSPTEQRLEIGSKETSNTLTTVQKDNLVVEPVVFDMHNKKQITNGICCTITANGNTSSTHCGTFGVLDKEQSYRIRKLTERECFRLMGVNEEDFERVRYGKSLPQGSHKKIVNRTMTKIEWKERWRIIRHDRQSISSCYHLAGDSIVTTCLMAIFGELFNIDYQEKINDLVGELKQ